MNELGGIFAALVAPTDALEFVVATVTSVNPVTVTWNGTDIPNPASLDFTPAIGQYVACLRQGAAFFVLGPIVNRS